MLAARPRRKLLTRYVINRLIAAVLTVLVTTIAVAMLIHIVPGDPVRILFAQSQGTTPEHLEAVRAQLGLDRPVWEQYFMYMGRVLQGDLGHTIRGNQSVLALLAVRLPNTLILAGTSLVIATLIGLTVGFIAAYRRGSWLDTGLMTATIVGVSIPHFWLGMILLFIFSVNLAWLPVGGSGWMSLILPAVTLGVANAAIIARLTRSSMIDIFNQDFIRTARAKGLPKAVVLSRHALRAGLVPVVTMLGLQFTYMMGGAIVVENVFGWNGIGRLAIQAIFQRDYPLIQGFILMFACMVVMISLIIASSMRGSTRASSTAETGNGGTGEPPRRHSTRHRGKSHDVARMAHLRPHPCQSWCRYRFRHRGGAACGGCPGPLDFALRSDPDGRWRQAAGADLGAPLRHR
ncbi:MAG TPA: ABC transporter permease [Kiloniellales bacterium]|nr:ABC transporter permease [Kiloniellales bacterium]